MQEYLHQILALPDIKERCQLMYNILKRTPDNYIKLLNEDIEFETKIGVWDVTTRRHKTILAEKWLRQQGVLKILYLIATSENRGPIEEQVLREFYHQCLTFIYLLKFLFSKKENDHDAVKKNINKNIKRKNKTRTLKKIVRRNV
ncbi:hypothetical protein CAJAP_07787 [Camponotus japonicus]